MAIFHTVALLLVLGFCATCDTRQEFVDEGGGEFSCTEASGAVRPCHILEYAAEQTANSSGPVTIVIHNSHSTPNRYLSRPVMFENIRGLTIQGNDTLVLCNAGGGLIFQSITDLEVSSLYLMKCGIAPPGGNLWAAVHVRDCTNVSLRLVTITRSEGAALAMINTGGEVLMSELLVADNGHFTTHHLVN